MPGKSHREARDLFKQQASQITQEEFLRWFELTYVVDEVLNRFSTIDPKIPTLFVMGDQDHLFLGPLRQILSNLSTAELVILENCGHVCNIERPESFNQTVINFLVTHS
jgi:pimeloyl-ACP methyl ester carboxylesterase